ncbi:MAG: phosphoribosylamine--glycine ligase [Clostridiaceae bacterium]
MKVLIIGNGGREHAMCLKISESDKVDKIFCAPGNGGTFFQDKCENINIVDIDKLIEFVKENKVDLTVVGPEQTLTEGIVDKFKAENLRILGPSKKAAALEGSKSYSKEFMKKYGIKTADYAVFEDIEKAKSYLKTSKYPIVIKADGLAAGKGVAIVESEEDAFNILEEFMIKDKFKGSGKKIVVEEFLEGVEASILSICDGETIIPFMSSKDHKNIFDENKGPNTGGMGTISPNPYCTKEVLDSFNEEILKPTLKGIKEENLDFIGFIFFGLMINEKGVYLLEYNARLGDPETQVVLPLMESDFLDLIENALDKNLKNTNITWKDEKSCCIVAASYGYPLSYNVGYEIKGLEKIKNNVFIAGAKEKQGKVVTTGGRVLGVTGCGKTLEDAIKKAYENIGKINFTGMYYRKDIGKIY